MKIDKKVALPLWIIVVFLLFVVLYLGKNIFIMLTFSFILLIFFSWIYRYFFKKTDSTLISALITGLIFVLFFGFIGFIISTQIDSFAENYDKIGKWFWNLVTSNSLFSRYFWDLNFQNIFSKIDFSAIGSSALGVISGILGWLVTVGLLLVFILLEKDV